MKNKITISIFASLMLVIAGGFFVNQNNLEQPLASQQADFGSSMFGPKIAHALPPPGTCPSAQDNMTMSFARLKVDGTTIADTGPIIARPPQMDISIGTYENPVKFNITPGSQITIEADNTGASDMAVLWGGDYPDGIMLWDTDGENPAVHQTVTTQTNTSTYVTILSEYDFAGCPPYNHTPVICVNPGGASGSFPPTSCYYEGGGGNPTPGTPSARYTISIFIELAPPTSNLPTRKEFDTSLAIVKRPEGQLRVNGQTEVTVPVGTTPTLAWDTVSVNTGNSCTASNTNNDPNTGDSDPTWEGPKNGPGGGSQSVGPMTRTGTFNYNVFCTGLNGANSSTATVRITVTPLPVVPTATLSCVGSTPGTPGPGPCDVVSGSNGNLTWSSVNATSCSIDNGISPPPLPPNSTGNGISTGDLDNPPTATKTFTLLCTGPGGTSAPSRVTFNVQPAPIVPNPTADLKCKVGSEPFTNGPCRVLAGQSATLQAESTNATSCTLTPAIAGYTPTPNQTTTTSTGPLSAPRTYSLECVGQPGSTPYTDAPIRINVDIDPTGTNEFDFVCSPVIRMAPGETRSFVIETSGDYTGTVSFSHTISPAPAEAPSVTNPPSQVPGNPRFTESVVTTSTDTLTGDYVVTFVMVGGGQSVAKDCYVTVEDLYTPQPPLNVTASQGTCEIVNLNWNDPSGPTPSSYKLYHSLSSSGGWVQFAQVPANPPSNIPARGVVFDYQYSHDSPNLNVSNYYAIKAVYSPSSESGYSTPSQGIIPISCQANMTLSDKDVIAVTGKITQTFSPVPIPCNDYSEPAILPSKALFTVGDRVTFQINICNSSEDEALTNATLTDTMYNLNNSDTQYNLQDARIISTTPNGCATNTTTQTSELGVGLEHTLDFNIAPIPPKPRGRTAPSRCSIVFSAVLTPPGGTGSQVYRFQNMGIIRAPGLPNEPISTPPYLFSLTGIPDRTETAPPKNSPVR